MDWFKFKLLWREHWKMGILVIVVAVAVIAAITTALIFTIGQPNITGPSSTFNGPADINGDPAGLNSNVFEVLQVIDNPIDGAPGFAVQSFVHDAGFIAVVKNIPTAPQSTSQVIVMFSTNLDGVIELETTLPVPEGYTVVDGGFAPIFNLVNEVYYLFVSVGVVCQSPDCNALDPSVDGRQLLGRRVLLFSYDSHPNARQWVAADFRGDSVLLDPNVGGHVALKLPRSDFTWNPSQPWIGTFGDKLQVVLDDNNTTQVQSLYVRGSEVVAREPGGCLYWYLLIDNNVNPQIQFNLTIKDARLLLLYQANQAGLIGARPTKLPVDYANGFASSFYVTSGRGRNNLLVIANPSNDDYTELKFSNGGSGGPGMPNGYVQIYVLSTSDPNIGWTQSSISGAPGRYHLRYNGQRTPGGAFPARGWCYAVGVVENFLMIGGNAEQTNPVVACSTQKQPQGKFAEFEVWVIGDLSTQCSSSESCDSNQSYRGSLVLDFGFQPALYYGAAESIAMRYNHVIRPIENNNILVSVFNNGPGNTITITNYTDSDSSKSGSSDLPFTCFEKIQDIGANENSGEPLDTIIARYAFGQGLGWWYSRTRGTLYLAVTDPIGPRTPTGNPGAGRLIIYAKLPEVE